MADRPTGGPEALTAVLRDLLADPARHPVLVALDFDGTLAPLQDDPQASRILPEAVTALRSLAGRPDVLRLALLSGRSMADLHALAEVPPGTALIGSHGAERARVAAQGLDRDAIALTDEQAGRLARLGAELTALARDRDGVWVESKPAAAVLHTRRADPATAAEVERAALAVGDRLGSKVLHGKKVVEISVLDSDKGAALLALRDELGAGAVVCAGDDVTDEHAFEALGPDDVTVKIGDGATHARFRVPDPDAFAALLTDLAAALAVSPADPAPGTPPRA
jgi:trehalose 6-phosphate phosphatase